MAVSLLETFQTYLTTDVLEQISVFLGESVEATEMAVQAAVPALLAGLTERMSTTLGSERVMSLIKQVGARLDIPALLGVHGGGSGGGSSTSAVSSPPFGDLTTLGSGLLAAIFGSGLAPIVETLATASGMRTESALSLLSLLTSIVLGVLGREVSSEHLGAASLASVLASQRDEINAFVPASLGALMSGSPAAPAEPPRPSRPATAWLVPAAAVVVLALAGWYFLRPYSLEERRAAAFSPATPAETPTAPAAPAAVPASPPPPAPAPAPAVTKAPAPTVAAAPPAAAPPAPSADDDEDAVPRGKITSVALPGGRSVKLEAGSANYQLHKFLASAGGAAAAAAVPRSFTFDRLNFQSNSTSLMRRSHHIVSELIAILTAYPDVNIRLEGHTDDRGDAERNKTLSLMRANAIKAKLVAAGVAESRVATEGVGREKPIATNNTVQGRRQNRRIELVVVKR